MEQLSLNDFNVRVEKSLNKIELFFSKTQNVVKSLQAMNPTTDAESFYDETHSFEQEMFKAFPDHFYQAVMDGGRWMQSYSSFGNGILGLVNLRAWCKITVTVSQPRRPGGGNCSNAGLLAAGHEHPSNLNKRFKTKPHPNLQGICYSNNGTHP